MASARRQRHIERIVIRSFDTPQRRRSAMRGQRIRADCPHSGERTLLQSRGRSPQPRNVREEWLELFARDRAIPTGSADAHRPRNIRVDQTVVTLSESVEKVQVHTSTGYALML